MKALILDLRGNPGGLLDQAVKVCSKFLPRSELVVTTEGREASQRQPYYADGRNVHRNLPLVLRSEERRVGKECRL